MHFKRFTLTALAAGATAQSMNLIQTLQSTPELSNLTALISANQALANQLNSLSNVTVLAPNNAAIAALMNSSVATMLTSTPGLLQAVLTYHILNGTYRSFANTSFVHSALMDKSYSNVTGGQVVEATAMDGNVTFISGLMSMSKVASSSPLNFTGGVAHIIDTVLTVPQNLTTTAVAFNLTSAVGALMMAPAVANNFTTKSDLTLFIPDNDAFQAIGSALPNLTSDQLMAILDYHCIDGAVVYSTDLMNGTSVMTSQGNNVTIYLEDDQVFVNSARVVVPDVLIANGVVHVIDEVLNPMNTTAMPNPQTTEPAFPGASSASDVPFTSGVPTPTSMIDTSAAATATGGASSSGGAWKPAATGAIGAAALFGGAAVMLNM